MAVALRRNYTTEGEYLTDYAKGLGTYDQEIHTSVGDDYLRLMYGISQDETKDLGGFTQSDMQYLKNPEDRYMAIIDYYQLGSTPEENANIHAYVEQQVELGKAEATYNSLNFWEKTIYTIGGTIANATTDLFLGTAQGLVTAVASIVGDDTTLTGDVLGYQKAKETLNDFNQSYTAIGKNGLATIVNDVTSAVARMAPMIAGGALAPVTGGASLAVGQAIYFGGMYGNVSEELQLQHPEMTWLERNSYASITTGLEWALEKLSGGLLTGGKGLFKAWRYSSNTLVQLGLEALGEGFEEICSETANAIMDLAYFNETDTTINDILYAGLIGALSGAVITSFDIGRTQKRTITVDGKDITLTRGQTRALQSVEADVAKNLEGNPVWELRQSISQITPEMLDNITNYESYSKKTIESVGSLVSVLDKIGASQFTKSFDVLTASLDGAIATATSWLNSQRQAVDPITKASIDEMKKQYPGYDIELTDPRNMTYEESRLIDKIERTFGQRVYVGKFNSKNGSKPIIDTFATPTGALLINSDTIASMSYNDIIDKVVKQDLVKKITIDGRMFSNKQIDKLADAYQELYGLQDMDKAAPTAITRIQQAEKMAALLLADAVTVRNTFFLDKGFSFKFYKRLKTIGTTAALGTIRGRKLFNMVNKAMRLWEAQMFSNIGSQVDKDMLKEALELSEDRADTLFNKYSDNKMSNLITVGFDMSTEEIMKWDMYKNLTQEKIEQGETYIMDGTFFSEAYNRDSYNESFVQQVEDLGHRVDPSWEFRDCLAYYMFETFGFAINDRVGKFVTRIDITAKNEDGSYKYVKESGLNLLRNRYLQAGQARGEAGFYVDTDIGAIIDLTSLASENPALASAIGQGNFRIRLETNNSKRYPDIIETENGTRLSRAGSNVVSQDGTRGTITIYVDERIGVPSVEQMLSQSSTLFHEMNHMASKLTGLDSGGSYDNFVRLMTDVWSESPAMFRQVQRFFDDNFDIETDFNARTLEETLFKMYQALDGELRARGVDTSGIADVLVIQRGRLKGYGKYSYIDLPYRWITPVESDESAPTQQDRAPEQKQKELRAIQRSLAEARVPKSAFSSEFLALINSRQLRNADVKSMLNNDSIGNQQAIDWAINYLRPENGLIHNSTELNSYYSALPTLYALRERVDGSVTVEQLFEMSTEMSQNEQRDEERFMASLDAPKNSTAYKAWMVENLTSFDSEFAQKAYTVARGYGFGKAAEVGVTGSNATSRTGEVSDRDLTPGNTLNDQIQAKNLPPAGSAGSGMAIDTLTQLVEKEERAEQKRKTFSEMLSTELADVTPENIYDITRRIVRNLEEAQTNLEGSDYETFINETRTAVSQMLDKVSPIYADRVLSQFTHGKDIVTQAFGEEFYAEITAKLREKSFERARRLYNRRLDRLEARTEEMTTEQRAEYDKIQEEFNNLLDEKGNVKRTMTAYNELNRLARRLDTLNSDLQANLTERQRARAEAVIASQTVENSEQTAETINTETAPEVPPTTSEALEATMQETLEPPTPVQNPEVRKQAESKPNEFIQKLVDPSWKAANKESQNQLAKQAEEMAGDVRTERKYAVMSMTEFVENKIDLLAQINDGNVLDILDALMNSTLTAEQDVVRRMVIAYIMTDPTISPANKAEIGNRTYSLFTSSAQSLAFLSAVMREVKDTITPLSNAVEIFNTENKTNYQVDGTTLTDIGVNLDEKSIELSKRISDNQKEINDTNDQDKKDRLKTENRLLGRYQSEIKAIRENEAELASLYEKLSKATTDEQRASLQKQIDSVQASIAKSRLDIVDIEFNLALFNNDYNRVMDIRNTVTTGMLNTLAASEGISLRTMDGKTIFSKFAKWFSAKGQERLRNWRFFAMLSNPATIFRNIVGNTLMTGLDMATSELTALFDRWKNYEAAPEDKVQYRFTAKQEVSSEISEYVDETFVQSGQTQYMVHGNKYDPDLDVGSILAEIKKRATHITDIKALQFIEKYYDFIMKTMDYWDQKSVSKMFLRNISKMLAANQDALVREARSELLRRYRAENEADFKVKAANDVDALAAWDGNFTQVMKYVSPATLATFTQQSMQMAMETYFKSDNAINRLWKAMSKKHPVVGALLSIINPFVRVSSNILLTITKYSPAGWGYVLNQFIKNKRMFDPNYKGYIDHFGVAKLSRAQAQASLGTVLTVAGIVLAAIGFIDIDDDDYLGAIIKLGDVRIRMSDLAPAATPIAIGAAFIRLEESDKSVMEQVMGVLYDQTLLGNFSNLLQYNDSLDGMLGSLVANYLTQYIPTLVRNISRVIDPSTKQKSSNFFLKTLQSIVDGTPFRFLLPNKIDPYTGDPVKRFATGRIGELIHIFNPVRVSINDASDVERESIENDARTSGSSGKFKVDGEEYELKGHELAQFRIWRAQYIRQYTEELIATSTYKNADTETKKKMLKSIQSKATEYAKQQYLQSKKS